MKLQALQCLHLTCIKICCSEKVTAVKLNATEPKRGLHESEVKAYREWWCTLS